MSIELVALLMVSGVAVGFINTLAGGATVISMSVFMALGLPIITAAGTNRIPVIMQNLMASIMFRKQKLLSFRQAFRYTVPLIFGSLVGAQLTNVMGNTLFSLIFIAGLIFFAFMLFYKASDWVREGVDSEKPTKMKHNIILFFIGVYCGSVYVGMGYLVLMLFVLMLGYNLVKANAIKNFMALIVAPATLVIFILNDNVNYEMGLIHGVGNVLGAYIAAKNATKIGVKTIRVLLIIVVIFSIIITMSKPEVVNFFKSLL